MFEQEGVGHPDNLYFGDLVVVDLGHEPLPVDLVIGRVFFVNEITSRVVVSAGGGRVITAWTEAVQWLVRARNTVFDGGAKKTWHDRD